MKIKTTTLLFWCCLVLAACTSSPSPQASATPPPPPANEDDLLLRLSSELVDNPQTQSDKDKNAIINYALDKSIEVQTAPSGLYYQIIEAGEGDKAKWGDYVTAHYKGYTLDGKVFDSSFQRNKPMQFYIGNMIKGWNEGLALLKPKGKAIFLVPSHLAYGTEGLGKVVAPNTPLVFEVELLKVEKK